MASVSLNLGKKNAACPYEDKRPLRERMIEHGIVEKYGMYLGFTEVRNLLRCGKDLANEWLLDVAFVYVGQGKRWSASSIAEKLFMTEACAAEESDAERRLRMYED